MAGTVDVRTARPDEPLRQALSRAGRSPERLAEILGSYSTPLIAFSADRWIRAANPAAEAFFGYSAHELDGRPTDVIVAERFRQPNAPPMLPVSDLTTVELPALRRDGTEILTTWTFSSTPTAAGPLFVMSIRDAAQTALDRFRAIYEGALDGIVLLHDDQSIADVNPAACRLLGRSREELLGMSASSLVPPAERDHGRERNRRFRAAGALTGENAILLPDGTVRRAEFAVVANVAPGLHVSTFRDIEDRKRAEEAQKFLDEASTILAASLDYDETLASVGRLAVPRVADWVGVDLLEPDGSFRRVAVAHVEPAKIELADELRRRRRRRRRAHGQARAVRGRERRGAAGDAGRPARRAMLGHELRNPLSPIVTALKLLRMHGVQTGEQDIIERQVDHLVRLVDDLLDVSRITRGKIELRKTRVELAEVVLRGLEQASPLLEQRRQPVEVDLGGEGLTVDADPARLAQVISNLLTNASKYSDAGRPVRVRAERAGDLVRLTVSDEGIGIPAGLLGTVFDVFFQTPQDPDRAKGGLGLGLAIVRNLVELHGGRVWAESAGPGKESAFHIELPLAARRDERAGVDAAGVPAPSWVGRPAAHEPGRRVLVVDDNEDTALTVAQVLTDLGHDVKTAPDGVHALCIVKTFKPDVCLLDIGLPAMDGYELARRLRESRDLPSGARLIAVTGYGQDADRQRSIEAGFASHLVKPVSFEDLTQAVGA